MATNRQIQKIHIAKNYLGFDDEEYRTFLKRETGKESSKDLTFHEADKVLYEFKRIGWKEKARNGKAGDSSPKKMKYEDLGKRPGMATPKQLRMIEAMWMTGPNIREKTQEALRRFLKNKFAIHGMRFIEEIDVSRIVKSIDSINQGKSPNEAE